MDPRSTTENTPEQPVSQAPQSPQLPANPISPTPMTDTSGSVPSPQSQVAIPLRKGLVIMLMLGDLIFFIPSMWAVIIYYGKYRKAAQTGDVEAARKSLKAIKLWGFIGIAIGIPLFILYIIANFGKS